MSTQWFEGLLEDTHQIDRLVDAIMRKMRSGRQDADEHRVPQEICFRALCWLKSTLQLSLPTDAFSIASAARAILESVVDASLANHLPDGRDRIRAWDESLKLRAAEKILAACGTTSREPPKLVRDFVANHGRRIQDQRQRLWRRKGHPPRWTASENFETDVEKVDEFENQPLYLGFKLSEFALIFYYRACGYVHATGLAEMRQMDRATMETAHLFFRRHTNALMLLCAKLCVRSIEAPLISEASLTELHELEQRIFATYGRLEQGLRRAGF